MEFGVQSYIVRRVFFQERHRLFLAKIIDILTIYSKILREKKLTSRKTALTIMLFPLREVILGLFIY